MDDLKDFVNQAMKELNEEGLFNGNEITEKGRREFEKGNPEVEDVIKNNKQLQTNIFLSFWNKLENSFYVSEPKEFSIRLLKFAVIMKRIGIDLQECLEWIRGKKK